ncbi:hypothetical protein F3Y22_tig00109987pilonHSYRG00228 [Hibiscus syriacus]|uniref:Uncharacterized protein n=1 Tax=Hibiscus syriacus TaxID=106335 RepID=A0A6A3BVJ5_HIBSY|nr:hypothetical protein F3Y22_tig00109987pilonHSYRG00228 [Hibiscus syriacus]
MGTGCSTVVLVGMGNLAARLWSTWESWMLINCVSSGTLFLEYLTVEPVYPEMIVDELVDVHVDSLRSFEVYHSLLTLNLLFPIISEPRTLSPLLMASVFSSMVILSVVLTAMGVIVASIRDFPPDLLEYTMALTSVSIQNTDHVPRVGGEVRYGERALIDQDNVLQQFPFSSVFAISHLSERRVPKFLGIVTCKVLSLVMGIALNYTMFLCTIVNSALTTTIVRVPKGVGSTVSELDP